MAQVVSCRPLTLDIQVQSHVISCGICDRKGGIGTGFSPNTSVARCPYRSINVPYFGCLLSVSFHQCAILRLPAVRTVPSMCNTSVARCPYRSINVPYFGCPLSVPFHQCAILRLPAVRIVPSMCHIHSFIHSFSYR
jgi:hypothetical protein